MKAKNTDTDVFKDPTALSKWLVGLFYTVAAIAVVLIISSLFEIQLLLDIAKGAYESEEMLEADAQVNDTRQILIGVILSCVFVILWITGFRWIYRCNYNCRQLGAIGMRYSPGWSVGWWFIPVFSVWKPYCIMREIWQASHSPDRWKDEKPSSLLKWCWALIVLSALCSSATKIIARNADTLELIQLSTVSSIVYCLFLAITCLWCIKVVKAICVAQMDNYKKNLNREVSVFGLS